ncbi:MAG: FtsX-like permease family protein [Cytophagales bacterium]|nr:FtsX-like permease family protein [Cytophagales bacterium]
MIAKLSWKNIWRSRRRSLTVIGAIAIGVWALIFMIGFYNSFGDAFIRSAVNYEYAHIQIHHADYLEDPDLKYVLEDYAGLEDHLGQIEEILSYSDRMKVNAMLASPKTNTGIQVFGIDPAKEANTTQLSEQMVEGTYFQKFKRNPILISEKLAEKLKVKIRSKVVLTFQDKTNEITAAAFRVEGIFNSKSPAINEGVVYVRKDDLAKLTLIDQPHEIGILLHSAQAIDSTQIQIAQFTSNSVRSYKEVAPQFNLMEESSEMITRIMTVIMMLALLFGIINTMLMAVLERTREIGMLRSIGMHKSKVFSMILLETLFLGMLGGPVGCLLGLATITWLNTKGLDMSAYADALAQYGAEAIFYPAMQGSEYISLMLVVIFTAFVGAIYPALKAIHLNPLEAIRKL